LEIFLIDLKLMCSWLQEGNAAEIKYRKYLIKSHKT